MKYKEFASAATDTVERCRRIRRQFQFPCGEVLAQMGQRCSARDQKDLLRASEEPGKRDLHRVVATQNFATAAGQPFLEWIPRMLFWPAVLAWTLTFVSAWVHLLRGPRSRS